ncbi:hypothetical protein [Pseudomonas arsenicoxydans]|uniref:Uncharacterized protein n=1 Tax=Pseudomonas arsenicoxydans TaxID=702115 RepID=A0A4P6FZX6_9PSED|nr:hypothetical protein [Pseudomonas arsenicoxydans]QAY84643.1 hypothetical protein CUN61_11865 [Pseudomonas arsenicoxydans]
MSDLKDIATRATVYNVRQRLIDVTTKDIVPPKQHRSQLSQINNDLCKSVCEAAANRGDPRINDEALVDDFVVENAQRITDLLSAIPSAFHHVRLKTQSGEIMLFDLSVPEMLEAAKSVTETGPEEVIKAYGTVWAHTRVLSELKPASASKSRQDLFLNISKDGVEYIAELYLDADDFISPLLEWAIVDALVSDRVTEFALACAFTGNLPDTPAGQLVDGPLLPGAGPFQMGAKVPSWLSIFGSGIAQAVGKLVAELIALGVTWGVSDWITSGDGSAKWTLFTGVTAARWVCGAIKSRSSEGADAKGAANLQMLWDMGIAHERVPAMNVDLLRHLFYRLEERGAAFNHVVYSILDKRARREALSR